MNGAYTGSGADINKLALYLILGAVHRGNISEFIPKPTNEEHVTKRIYKNENMAQADIFNYIEVFYNRAWRHSLSHGSFDKADLDKKLSIRAGRGYSDKKDA